ncbi:MAG: DUF11 domain-containing protein [FCB group bacterium]|nr:DUF11 domain-containing protein [FCB group bacterium]MBL7028999.1 DUF11 domain-containing protein [Candidatus Neomarinimicrobiota bacterium]MBL7122530.1 DUF11 domain-containing protein [Candidatus Neomarinimicrobiota bacterium]
MRTRNETYSGQTSREKTSVSQKTYWLKSSEIAIAGTNAENSSPVGAWKNRKTSVQNHTDQMIKSIFNVTILTSGMGDKSAQKASAQDEMEHNLVGNQIELKERKMKDVLGSITKYAIYAIMTLSVVMGQGTPKLDIHIDDVKVNLTAAEMKDASLVNYSPGDTLRYVLTASNVGDGLMTNPEIVDPIPAGVTYVPNTARGADTEITYSMNQGNTYMAWPPFYTVRNSKGILVKRDATPEMITHIKWNISKNLDPGDVSSMEFLVVVNK